MERQTRGKPLLFILFLLFGTALFLIYNLMMPFSAGRNIASNEDVSYLEEAQDQQPEGGEEQSVSEPVPENDNQTATSRGQSASRYIDRERKAGDSQAGKGPADSQADRSKDSQTGQTKNSQAADPQTDQPEIFRTETTDVQAETVTPPAQTMTPDKTVTPSAQAMTPDKEEAPEMIAESAAEKPDITSDDLDLLARLITAEAQGEPYEAQVAIGAVVLNRVQSGVWPDTIKSVIYQKIGGYYQFTPVVNGWIDKPAQAEAVKAAKEALNGVDPTGGAQFYYDDTCTNEWILAKPVSTQIGHMIFAM